MKDSLCLCNLQTTAASVEKWHVYMIDAKTYIYIARLTL